MTTNKINKTHAVEDGIIALNGEISERHRAEARVKDAKKGRGKESLTDAEDETLDELKARLAKRAQCDDGDTLVKSLRGTVSNFLRSRKRRGPELMSKSLRNDQRLVLPKKKEVLVTSELFIKAANAFNFGKITSQEFNVIDLHRRNRMALPDELLKKIGE
ncbi:hypothetical protein [Klebsiella variicola]|uniref:hypothetical protein n=1 Tax=Klebsiella variicola TaxID=244366 RepID=UPI001083214F|nr:hypothetical protein [Klebsiella variicola]VFZ87272.1 Uncharacterised protein [Klebsiella variicola]HDX8858936.1 hypothetical protein [Klebsiella michiganensis]